MYRFLLLLAFLLAATPAGAVIISSGDGTGNTTPPADDPGWAYVGVRGGASATYLGNRWVVTAAHVGAGDTVLGGRTYSAVAGSTIPLQNEDLSLAGLVLYRLGEDPGLPPLRIAATPRDGGESLVMIGAGRNRGEPTCWYGRCGWNWGVGRAMRWGTNEIANPSFELRLGGVLTHTFFTDFSEFGTLHEAHAADGDSGGAGFVKRDGAWELAGLIVAIGPAFQPGELAIFGSVTFFADLARYRDQIVRWVAPPACRDGLDNDANGRIDYPEDKGCSSADDASEVSGQIEIALSPQDLGDVTLGESRSAVLTITNVGGAPLAVDAIKLSQAAGFALIEVPPLPLQLAPQRLDAAHSTAQVEVRFTPPVVGLAQSLLAISSDDPHQPDVRLAVRANAVWALPADYDIDRLKVELGKGTSPKSKVQTSGGVILLGAGEAFDPSRDEVALELGSFVLFRSVPERPPARVGEQRWVYAAGTAPGKPKLDLDLAKGAFVFTLDGANLPDLGAVSSVDLSLQLGIVRGTLTLERREGGKKRTLEYE